MFIHLIEHSALHSIPMNRREFDLRENEMKDAQKAYNDMLYEMTNSPSFKDERNNIFHDYFLISNKL